MRYLPIALDVRDRDALVIGAGPGLTAKIDRLLACGARVTVVAPDPDPAIVARAAAGDLVLHRREPVDEDLERAAIAFAAPATTSAEVEREARFHAAAARAGRLFCAVDRPEASTFINLAIADTPALTLVVGTDGRNPAVAHRVREDLEAAFSDPRFTRFVERLAALRAALPRGERAARMSEAVKGFAVALTVRFPDWFERGDEP